MDVFGSSASMNVAVSIQRRSFTKGLREVFFFPSFFFDLRQTSGLLEGPTTCSLELISHGIVFFSYNKSANSTFQAGFLAKRTGKRPERRWEASRVTEVEVLQAKVLALRAYATTERQIERWASRQMRNHKPICFGKHVV
jgi:hypothetical protein